MKLLLISVVAALLLPATSMAHIPFIDGPGSAPRIAKHFDTSQDLESVKCRYIKPHVFCTGLIHWGKGAFLPFTMTVHKTAPKKGYAMICVKAAGVCHKKPLTFQG